MPQAQLQGLSDGDSKRFLILYLCNRFLDHCCFPEDYFIMYVKRRCHRGSTQGPVAQRFAGQNSFEGRRYDQGLMEEG